MPQCPKCGGETADSQRTCGVCGTPIDGAAPVDCYSKLAAVATIVESPFRPKPRRAPVGVPRRFSIGTMMIMVTAFAVLFAVLKTLGAPPAVFAAIAIFVGGIAACQSLLFKGKKPRLASCLAGSVMMSSVAVVITLLGYFTHLRHNDMRMMIAFVQTLVVGGITAVFVGGGLGYVVGCFIASIFLVRKEPDDAESAPEDGC